MSKEVEEVKKHGIDVMLKALSEYCNGDNCNDCWYLNKTDGLCQAIERTMAYGEFPDPKDIPYGDRYLEEDE